MAHIRSTIHNGDRGTAQRAAQIRVGGEQASLEFITHCAGVHAPVVGHSEGRRQAPSLAAVADVPLSSQTTFSDRCRQWRSCFAAVAVEKSEPEE